MGGLSHYLIEPLLTALTYEMFYGKLIRGKFSDLNSFKTSN